MRMPSLRRHLRPLLGLSIALRSDFLVNAEIENKNCRDPEKEDQILHDATSRPVSWQVTYENCSSWDAGHDIPGITNGGDLHRASTEVRSDVQHTREEQTPNSNPSNLDGCTNRELGTENWELLFSVLARGARSWRHSGSRREG